MTEMDERQNDGKSDGKSDGKNDGKKHRKRGRRMVDLLLIAVIVVCGFLLAADVLSGIRQRQQEEELRRIALQTTEAPLSSAPEETKAEETKPAETEAYRSPIDFTSLSKVNPDIVAWVEVPGTEISYPVVQTSDNETYLKRDFEGNTSTAGTIFLDCDSDGDLMGLHSILYGHHMKNQTMFAQLVKFKDEAFFDQHREVILYTPERELHLKTIAAVYGDADGEKRRTSFSSQEVFNQYVDEMTKNCSFRELPEGDIEGLYSFVTCSYEFQDARTILYAVRETDEAENRKY